MEILVEASSTGKRGPHPVQRSSRSRRQRRWPRPATREICSAAAAAAAAAAAPRGVSGSWCCRASAPARCCRARGRPHRRTQIPSPSSPLAPPDPYLSGSSSSPTHSRHRRSPAPSRPRIPSSSSRLCTLSLRKKDGAFEGEFMYGR